MEQITVNLLATGETPVCHASQFDDGRAIRFNLKKGAEVYTLSGTEEVKMRIRKPDNTERVVDIVNTSSSYVDYVSTPEDCDISGVNVCELVIDDLGSKNFNMNVEEDAYGGGADIETLTASGPVATFETNLVDNLVDLKANIEPIQDLHGYDYPWTGGGGKNLLPFENVLTEGWSRTNSGITAEYSNGIMHVYGTNELNAWNNIVVFNDIWRNSEIRLPAGTYSIPDHLVVRISEDNISYSNKTGTVTYTSPIFIRGFYISVPANYTVDWHVPMMFVYGSVIPTTYEPYSNICPITGYTEAKIVHAGKNLTNIAVLPYTVHWGTDAANLVQFLNTLPVGRYTISNKYKINEVPSSGKVLHGAFLIRALVNGEQINVTPYLLVTDNNPAVGKVYQESVSFEITEAIKGNINHAYRYCDQDNSHSGSGRGSYDCYDIQVELGSTATDYEPYAGTEVTVQFGQTIYKGVLDVKNSKVIATYTARAISTWTWAYNDTEYAFGYFSTGNTVDKAYNTNFDCECLNSVNKQRGILNNGELGVYNLTNASRRFVARCDNITTVNDFINQLGDYLICYELAEPIEIPLSAISQFETLLGVNNVYASTGDTELKYLKQM